MPEYLAPGVFVEETSFRAKSIEGVGTSVAALVGPTRTGPLRGVPEVLTSHAEFVRTFGDAADLDFGGTRMPNYSAHAARAFFDNGGKQLFVVRVIAGGNDTAADSSGGSAAIARSDAAVTDVTLRSRFPGQAGNLTLELRWRGGVAPAAGVPFDIDVRSGGRHGEILYTYANLSSDPARPNSLVRSLPATPPRRQDALTSPVSASTPAAATSAQIHAALIALCDASAMAPPAGSLDGPRYLIMLAGGTDGSRPVAIDHAGETDEVLGSTGLKALEHVEDVSIVMVPAAAADATTHVAITVEMQKHCRRMRYRVGLVDGRQGMTLSEVRTLAGQFDDSRLAIYHPWVQAADPQGGAAELSLPPSGFIAGVYARTDVDRGVHKAPANELVLGALRFEQEINAFQQELLNPNGINCLRSFVGRGHRVWGGRTLSSDPEWRYVNVRRYFLYLERSIEKSTQWAVFEPNGEALWANIRSSVEDFLFNEWRNARLLGGSPKEAYFVRCDRSTMTQNDIDNGRMVCLIGVAALKPAEFVIFRIGQKTANA